MPVVAFDTHAFVKRLVGAGMPEAQAEILADEQVRLVDERLATKADLAALGAATKADIAALGAATKADMAALSVATKADMAALRADTKADIAALGAELKIAIEASKSELIKWMFGVVGFQAILILGAALALGRALFRTP